MTSSFGYTPAVFVSSEQRHEFLQFAQQAARLAGAVVLPHFRTSISAQNKVEGKGFDPVTAADQGAETAIRKAIEETYPEHGIYGEEFGLKAGNGLNMGDRSYRRYPRVYERHVALGHTAGIV